MNNLWLRGTLSGVVATAAMTGVQLAGLKLLPAQNPEPERADGWDRWTPEHVFEESLEKAGLEPHLEDELIRPLAIASHFAYGAAWGGVYGGWRGTNGGDLPTGTVFGLAIWGLSYAGVLPSFRIVRGPQDEDPNRVIRLLLAHVVYGATLAAAYNRIPENGWDAEWEVEGGA